MLYAESTLNIDHLYKVFNIVSILKKGRIHNEYYAIAISQTFSTFEPKMANTAHCDLGVQNRTPQILSARMAHEWNKFSRFQTERQQSSWSGKRLFDGDVSQSETIRQPTDNRRPFIEWLIFFVGSQDLSDPIPSDPIPYDPIRSVWIRSDPIRNRSAESVKESGPDRYS